MALYGLPPEYSTICDQILGSPTVPSLNTTWSTLLRVPAKSSVNAGLLPAPNSELPLAPVDASALVSQGSGRGRTQSGQSGKPRPKCDHYHRLGHTIDKCWTLHGRPPSTANVVQVDPPAPFEPSPHPTASPVAYASFLSGLKNVRVLGPLPLLLTLVIPLLVPPSRP